MPVAQPKRRVEKTKRFQRLEVVNEEKADLTALGITKNKNVTFAWTRMTGNDIRRILAEPLEAAEDVTLHQTVTQREDVMARKQSFPSSATVSTVSTLMKPDQGRAKGRLGAESCWDKTWLPSVDAVG